MNICEIVNDKDQYIYSSFIINNKATAENIGLNKVALSTCYKQSLSLYTVNILRIAESTYCCTLMTLDISECIGLK